MHTEFDENHTFAVDDLIFFNKRATLNEGFADLRYVRAKVLQVNEYRIELCVDDSHSRHYGLKWTHHRDQYYMFSPWKAKNNRDAKAILHKK